MISSSLVLSTAVGNIEIVASENAITHCTWTRQKPSQKIETPLLREAASQLTRYLDGKLHYFELPFDPAGTDFQKRVWNALLKIPYGQTKSYQDIASAIGKPTAVRAVGNANGKNPLCIFIPCHRVVYASGKLGGYSQGIGFKEKLLSLESGRTDAIS